MVDNTILQEELDRVEEFEEDVQKQLDLYAALENLEKNEDFKALIGKGLLEDEAERVKDAFVDPETRLSNDLTEELVERLKTIKNVKAYFKIVKANGWNAKERLDEADSYVVKLKANPEEFLGKEEEE